MSNVALIYRVICWNGSEFLVAIVNRWNAFKLLHIFGARTGRWLVGWSGRGVRADDAGMLGEVSK